MPITRNRVIYAGTTVLMSDYPSWYNQTGDYSLKLLKRIQSSSISISNPVSRAKQIGSSAFAYEKYITQPEIGVNLSYLISDNSNELIMGLNATGNESILKNFASTGRDGNMFFVLSDYDGQDANSLTLLTGLDVFSVGNTFLNTYNLKADVGSVPVASASFSALNMTFQTYTGFSSSGPYLLGGSQIPAIVLPSGTKATGSYALSSSNLDTTNYLSNQDSRPSALRPGDIAMELEQPIMGGIRYSGTVPATITSFEVNVPIDRKDLVGFGSNYPYDKKVMYPVIGTLSFNGTFDEPVTGDFSNIFLDENNYDFTFNLLKNDGTTGLRVEVLDARVESQSFDLSIGNNMTFQSQFSFKIFQEDGLRISGAARLGSNLSTTIENTINNIISIL